MITHHLFSKPAFLYPPRAEQASNPINIDQYDNGEFLAQVKYNGDCVVIVMDENFFEMYNRHKGIYTKAKPGFITHELYRGRGTQVIVGEYLSKNLRGEYDLDINHSFVIWDILVFDSNYLIGQTFEQRLDLLEKLYPSSMAKMFGGEVYLFDYIRVTKISRVYRAATFVNDFSDLYSKVVEIPLYEGLILKKKNGLLTYGYGEKNNAGWQLKFRKPTKNYNF